MIPQNKYTLPSNGGTVITTGTAIGVTTNEFILFHL
jgi:hypothetical protein